MEHKFSDESIDIPFTFRIRPRPLPADLRPSFRMSILALVIDHCRSGRASVEQLHVMDWSIRTPESRKLFLDYLDGKKTPNQVIVRMDPSLTRALEFAIGENLVTHYEPKLLFEDQSRPATVLRFMLTNHGKKWVNDLIAIDDCLVDEKMFLKSIGSKVTQEEIHSLFDWNN